MNRVEAYFEDLLMRVIEGIATEEEFATFAGIIRQDAGLRDRYAREMRLHALLSCEGEAKGVRSAPVRSSRQGAWWKCAAAAAVLASGAAVWHAAGIARVRGKRGVSVEAAAPVVRVIRQRNVGGLDLPGALPGTLRIESGEVVVRLPTGVELTVLGPAGMEVQSGMRVSLERGRLLANVPHRAAGFTVCMPDLEVYDLGTVFGVNLTEGVSDVFVFKGSVQVNEAAGYSGRGQETAGAGVGICEAGEGVRAVSGKSPVVFVSDCPEAKEMYGRVQGDAAAKDPAAALETASQIADLWVERNLPRATLAVKMVKTGNGLPFRKTAWVRPAASATEEVTMNRASAAAALTAAAVMMGAGTTGATSAPIQVDTSPGLSRHWRTVFTNEVALRWDWNAAAAYAELKIEGMNGSFTSNFTEVTSNCLWRAFASRSPSSEDVYDLTLTFYGSGNTAVGALTSRLAVVTGAFGPTAVTPNPAVRSWTAVRDNVVIPYDAGWTAATADAARSQLVIDKSGGTTKTCALPDAGGYFGWKIKRSDWGYGTFSLTLTFPGTEGEWDATVRRLADGTMIWVQ
jgi:hypothetical protein